MATGIIESVLLKIAPSLASKLLTPIAEKLSNSGKEFAEKGWNSLIRSFDIYLKSTEDRHKYFNSQVFSNEGKLLEDYYIPLNLLKADAQNRRTKVKIDSFPKDLLSAYKSILIVDTAGMGKSTLLKFIFLQLVKEARSIPLFVELRKLSKTKTLKNFLLSELNNTEAAIPEQFLDTCLEQGIFTIFLDGFDEISDDDKKSVSNEILSFKSKFNKNTFILSSRDEPSLSSLMEFHRFNIKPLEKNEAFELIRKISPIPEVGERLIEKLGEQEQENLDDFLANPLLVSLLVKSFLHSNILPVRLSEFYRQVFDALYQNHDAKKELGGYTRNKKSGLDLDKFHKALRALGVLTYKDGKLEFSVDDLLSKIEAAKRLTAENVYSATDFQDDLLRAVPLFIQEGNSIRWAHRSLQEYFAASYICTDAKEKQETLLLQLYEKSVLKNINILTLCADIDEKTFKKTVVKKYLEKLIFNLENKYPPKIFPTIPKQALDKRRSFLSVSEMSFCIFKTSVKHDNWFKYIPEEMRMKLISGLDISRIRLYDSNFKLASHTQKVKCALIYSVESDDVVRTIIHRYFSVNLNHSNRDGNVKINPKNIPRGTVMQIDDSKDNCLNSLENFDHTTSIIYSHSLSFDEKKIRKFYSDILMDEKNSLELDISF